jgi:hypothetical protein
MVSRLNDVDSFNEEYISSTTSSINIILLCPRTKTKIDDKVLNRFYQLLPPNPTTTTIYLLDYQHH